MNEHNLKALYFCHTHTNLFLQKHCKNCKRGMCHTCLAHNSDYCKSCLKTNYRNSSHYEDKQEMIKVFLFSIIITCIVGCYLHFKSQPSVVKDLNETLLLVFFFSLSVASMHYLMKHTSFMNDVRKVPFIGFKLSIALLIIIIILGIPVFYIFFKTLKVLKHTYFKRPKIPSL